MRSSKILYTGAYVPETVFTNLDFEKIVDTSDEWIQSRSGIAQRHFSKGENTSEIASKAAKQIVDRGNINPLEIDLIIVATVSGDYTTPSTACLVQAAIGASNAVAFDVTAACSGFIFGLSTADKFIATGVYRNALVIGAEVLSKLLDFEDRGTCVLFGDGAGGVYLEAADKGGILAEDLGSDGSRGLSLTGGHRNVVNVIHEEEHADRYIHMDGRGVFEFSTRQPPKSIKKVIEKANISKEDIKYVVTHQANRRIVQVISRKTEIPLEQFYMNMDSFGNTSSASIPIALNEMFEKGLLQEGDKLLLSGFGGGLTWGSMLIEL